MICRVRCRVMVVPENWRKKDLADCCAVGGGGGSKCCTNNEDLGTETSTERGCAFNLVEMPFYRDSVWLCW